MKSWLMVLCCGLCMTACSGGAVDFEGVDGTEVTLLRPVAPTITAPTLAPDTSPPPAPAVGPTPGGNPPPPPPPDPPPPPPPVPCDMAWTLGELPTDANLPDPFFRLDFDHAAELFATGNGVTIYDGKFTKIPEKTNFSAVGDLVDGRAGRAVHLQHGYLALDPTKVLPLNGGATPLQQGSMAFWVGTQTFQAADGKDAVLVHSDNANGLGWIFNVDIRGKQLRYFAEQQATKDANGTPYIEYSITTPIHEWAAGAWHHVVVTWKRVTQTTVDYRMYVDGRLIDVDTSKNFPTGAALPKHLYLLSTHRWDNNAADGRFRMDAFRTYNIELSHAQVVALFRTGLDHAGPSLTAGRLRLQLLGTADGYGLAGIRDAADGLDKTMSASSRHLWQLHFQSTTIPKKEFTLNNEATGHAQRSCLFDAANHRMTLEWRDITPPAISGGNANERIHVTMTLTADPAEQEITAQLFVDNATTHWSAVKSVFPRIGGLGPIKSKPADTVLIRTGPNIGSLRRDPFTNAIWKGASETDQPLPAWQMVMEYPGTEVPMPWVALTDATDPTGGLYVAVHDPTWSIKTLQINHVVKKPGLVKFITDHGLDIAFATSVADAGTAGNDVQSPATAVLRLQDGSWFDMAMRYRRFLQSQPQMAGGTLAERMAANTIAPAPLGAGVFQSGSMYGAPLKILFDEISAQQGPPGLVWWLLNLWQEGSNYSVDNNNDGINDASYQAQMNNFPFAKPVQPAFTKNIDKGQMLQSIVTPYFSPISWDAIYDDGTSAQTNTDNWSTNKGAALSIVHADGLIENQAALGNLVPSFPTPSQAHMRMCPRAPQWQQIVVNAVAALKSSAALQGFYFDEVARKRPILCFGEGPTHNHTRGDPTYYVEGFRSILSTVRAQTGAITASEGFSDPYFDLLDGNLIEYLPWFEEEMVPITIATTHDYTQFLGWRTNVEFEPLTTMVAKQGQLFTWGSMPGGLLGSSLTLKPLQTYVAQLGILRQRWRPYLVLGAMGRSVKLQKTANPPSNNPTAVAPQNGIAIPLHTLTAYSALPAGTFQLPKITTSTWTAPNGIVGIVVTSLEFSLGGASHGIYVPVDRAALGLSGTSSKITVKSWDTETPLSWNGPGGVQLTIKPQQTYLIEIE